MTNSQQGDVMNQSNLDMNLVKKWITDNPQNADNMEDLFNWCCDQFDVPKEKLDEVFQMCQKIQSNL